MELLPPAPATSAHQRPRPPGRRSSPAPSPRPTGASYSPAEFVDAHEFTTPTVQGGLARWRAADAGDPGTASCSPVQTAAAATACRSGLRDEARTWSAPKLVYEALRLLDMTRLTDGRMGLLFEKGVASV
ncbi:MAG: hypothetical protein U1F77_07940 [Kiritimatiellia bacterium]